MSIGQMGDDVAPNFIAEKAFATIAIRLASGTPENFKKKDTNGTCRD